MEKHATLTDNERMAQWVVFVIYFYLLAKSMQQYSYDFQALISEGKIDEKGSSDMMMRNCKLSFAGCFALGGMTFVENWSTGDRKVNMAICPFILCGMQIAQSHFLYSFYNVKSVIDKS